MLGLCVYLASVLMSATLDKCVSRWLLLEYADQKATC